MSARSGSIITNSKRISDGTYAASDASHSNGNETHKERPPRKAGSVVKPANRIYSSFLSLFLPFFFPACSR